MIGAVSLAGLALVFVLLTGRLRIPSLRAQQAVRRANADPLTQPVSIPLEETAPSKPKTTRRSAARKKAAPVQPRIPDAPALLVRLNADGQPDTANPIPLVEVEITFGTDPVQASRVLDNPSISPLHARLRRTQDEDYLLSDGGSVAGTWVNYEPVPREGYRLQHGDVVHFGQLTYRFQLRKPAPASEPRVVLEKPSQ
jgi:pSer/pThr/pTyr-binding forkhead associated (FHA) protein